MMYGLRGMVIRFRLLTRKTYKYTIWQSTDGDGGGYLNTTKGLVAGIPSYSTVDIDFGYVDYTKIITSRWHAQTGYKASTRPDTSNYKGKPAGHRERKEILLCQWCRKNTAGFR